MGILDEVQTSLTLYDNTITHVTNHYFCNKRQFALPSKHNAVTWLQNGRVALEAIAEAIRGAQSFVWITDWQMGFDVELCDRGVDGHPGRLINIIEQLIRSRAVHVRILLYHEPFQGMPGVRDGQVQERFEKLMQRAREAGYPGTIECAGQGPTTERGLVLSQAFSHHQKSVVVDGSVAFLGGIDLTYGRHCGNEFDVVIDPETYVLNDMYNPCATKLRLMSPKERDQVKEGFATPYGDRLLEEGCQPRLPWQDVHIKLEGASAVDVHRNFARRWRSLKGCGDPFEKVLLPTLLPTLKKAYTTPRGNAYVQIVRSVSSSQLRRESNGNGVYYVEPPDLQIDEYPPYLRGVWNECLQRWHGQPQDNIENAMLNCILSAENYIYIESQFFISDFGAEGAFEMMPENRIAQALAERIGHHIVADYRFHVYLVLPVHPEGDAASGQVAGQQWAAMQTLYAAGEKSLVGRIQATLRECGRDEADWVQYLTILNLRSYGATVQYARDPKTFEEDYALEVGRYVVTEQVYIHSKIMIVDDLAAIVGSANLNDRSLSGKGDTEIAAVIIDEVANRSEDLGEPRQKPNTRKFARALRRGLWEKHFGFLIEPPSSDPVPPPNAPGYFPSQARAIREAQRRNLNIKFPKGPSHPPRMKTTADQVLRIGKQTWETILNKPCAPETVRAIQRIAQHNQTTYETVFTHTPRNSMTRFSDPGTHYTQPYLCAVEAGLDNNPMTQAAMRASMEGVIGAWAMPSDTRGVIPPRLQPNYMNMASLPHQRASLEQPRRPEGKRYVRYEDHLVHDVERALKDLQSGVVGFFVEMPLQWGSKDSGGLLRSIVPGALSEQGNPDAKDGVA
jgi:phospholipase D1/2